MSLVQKIEEGRKIWTNCMEHTVRYYEGNMTSGESMDYLTSQEDLNLFDPKRFIGVLLSSFEHPINFTKTFCYSIYGFLDTFFHK